MQGSGSGWKGRVRKSWQMLSGMFWAKVNAAACQEGILMSPCAFSSLFLSNRAVCRGGSRRCERARCLGRKDAITPEVRAQRSFRGAGAAPALGSSPGRAPACPGVRVLSCSMGCIPATSSEPQAATLRLESKSQLSHLHSFKYYFFFPPLWSFIHWSASWSNYWGWSDGLVCVCFIRGIGVSVLGG